MGCMISGCVLAKIILKNFPPQVPLRHPLYPSISLFSLFNSISRPCLYNVYITSSESGSSTHICRNKSFTMFIFKKNPYLNVNHSWLHWSTWWWQWHELWIVEINSMKEWNDFFNLTEECGLKSKMVNY